MKEYLSILRPVNCLMSSLSVYIAGIVAGLGVYPSLLTVYLMAAVFLVCAAGMIVNDIFDIEIDRINKPNRPLPSGKIKKKVAWIYAAVLFIAGLSLSWLVNIYALAIAVIASASLLLYAWRLKKIMLVGNITVALMVGLTFIFGSLVNMNYIPLFFLAVLAFLSNVGREIFKSIDDVEADRVHKANTLAVKYGVKKSRVTASVFILLAVALSAAPYTTGIFSISYLIPVIIADILFVSAIPFNKMSATICKIAMMVALVAFLAGALA